METWYTEYVELCCPANIQIDDAGGEMAFGTVQIALQGKYSQMSIWFRFQGSDEIGEDSGDGDAEVEDNGMLNGDILFNNGVESSSTAKR